MRRLLQVCAAALLMIGAPLAASAQTAFADDGRSGLTSVGAMGGVQLDTSDNWLLFGADLRLGVSNGFEIEPRFTYQPLDGGHVMQFDANLLKNLELAHPGRLRPFFGVGGTLRKLGIDGGGGDTKLGINLVSGTRIALSSGSGYEPFIVGQYSVVRNQLNSFSLVIGASFALGR